MVKDTLGSDIILRSLAHRSIAELQNGLIEEREIIPPELYTFFGHIRMN